MGRGKHLSTKKKEAQALEEARLKAHIKVEKKALKLSIDNFVKWGTRGFKKVIEDDALKFSLFAGTTVFTYAILKHSEVIVEGLNDIGDIAAKSWWVALLEVPGFVAPDTYPLSALFEFMKTDYSLAMLSILCSYMLIYHPEIIAQVFGAGFSVVRLASLLIGIGG